MKKISFVFDTPKEHDKTIILDFDSYNKCYEIKKVLFKIKYWKGHYFSIELLEEHK